MTEVKDAILYIVEDLELFADKLSTEILPFNEISDRQDYLHRLATIKSLLKDL